MHIKIKSIRLFWAELTSTIFVIGGAFLFHFIYEWSGNNSFIGLFSATNESVFEHIKILVYPYLIVSVFEYLFLSIDIRQYVVAKAVGLFLLPILVIVVFYTYTGIIGHHIPLVDMMSAILYAVLAQLISFLLLNSKRNLKRYFYPVLFVFFIMITAMLIFSVYPPHIPLFYDEANKLYGMR